MKRDFDRLSTESFDIVVVGGGILGAFVSLLATRRGFRVALLEKEDFASGTTGGSGKVLHGGVRYLQRLRLRLAQEAQHEQKRLAAAAPELVRPLPFLVPVREGHLRERLVVRAGAGAWKAFTKLTSGGADLPPARYSRGAHLRELLPDFDRGFRGGMLFHDVQLRSPERLTFEIVRRAAADGAAVANYAEVVGIQAASGRVVGVDVRDGLTGNECLVRAPIVVNGAGAWAPEIASATGIEFPDVALGKGIHVVIDQPEPAAALTLPFRGQSSSDPTTSGERRVFVMPWEGLTLVGASYSPFNGRPDQASVTGSEVSAFLTRLDSQWPELGLADAAVAYAYSGLYPVFGQTQIREGRYAASLRPLILDHGARGGTAGLFTAISVKLSTARALAEELVNRICATRHADTKSPSSRGEASRLPNLTASLAPSRLGDPASLPSVAREAARREMAANLSDVLFRRSWIGHMGHPGSALLEEAAGVMARVHGWSETERERQVREIDELYRTCGARVQGEERVRSERDAATD